MFAIKPLIEKTVNQGTGLIESLGISKLSVSDRCYKLEVSRYRLLHWLVVKAPASTITLIAFLSFLLKRHFVLQISDASGFVKRYPHRLDSSLEALRFEWGKSTEESLRQITIQVENLDSFPDSSLIDLLVQLGNAEGIRIVLVCLESQELIERFSNSQYNELEIRTFQTYFDLLNYSSNQSGIFIVQSEFSYLVALMAKNKTAISTLGYFRKDFSWGQIIEMDTQNTKSVNV